MTKARTLADNYAADISGITAGTGITGGGTSGTVTITNEMATTIDAKGDLVVGTGADTFGRLAVASTAGYLLTVDSGETTGLKWAAPVTAIPTFYGVELTNAGNAYSIANNTWTKVTFDQETYDAGGYASSGSTITIPSGKGGYYLVTGWAYWDQNATGGRLLKIYKNGTAVYQSRGFASNASIYPGSLISNVVSVSATDTIELYAFQNSGGSLNLYVYPVDAGLSAALIGV